MNVLKASAATAKDQLGSEPEPAESRALPPSPAPAPEPALVPAPEIEPAPEPELASALASAPGPAPAPGPVPCAQTSVLPLTPVSAAPPAGSAPSPHLPPESTECSSPARQFAAQARRFVIRASQKNMSPPRTERTRSAARAAGTRADAKDRRSDAFRSFALAVAEPAAREPELAQPAPGKPAFAATARRAPVPAAERPAGSAVARAAHTDNAAKFRVDELTAAAAAAEELAAAADAHRCAVAAAAADELAAAAAADELAAVADAHRRAAESRESVAALIAELSASAPSSPPPSPQPHEAHGPEPSAPLAEWSAASRPRLRALHTPPLPDEPVNGCGDESSLAVVFEDTLLLLVGSHWEKVRAVVRAPTLPPGGGGGDDDDETSSEPASPVLEWRDARSSGGRARLPPLALFFERARSVPLHRFRLHVSAASARNGATIAHALVLSCAASSPEALRRWADVLYDPRAFGGDSASKAAPPPRVAAPRGGDGSDGAPVAALIAEARVEATPIIAVPASLVADELPARSEMNLVNLRFEDDADVDESGNPLDELAGCGQKSPSGSGCGADGEVCVVS